MPVVEPDMLPPFISFIWQDNIVWIILMYGSWKWVSRKKLCGGFMDERLYDGLLSRSCHGDEKQVLLWCLAFGYAVTFHSWWVSLCFSCHPPPPTQPETFQSSLKEWMSYAMNQESINTFKMHFKIHLSCLDLFLRQKSSPACWL